jgi:hypothetical protein
MVNVPLGIHTNPGISGSVPAVPPAVSGINSDPGISGVVLLEPPDLSFPHAMNTPHNAKTRIANNTLRIFTPYLLLSVSEKFQNIILQAGCAQKSKLRVENHPKRCALPETADSKQWYMIFGEICKEN